MVFKVKMRRIMSTCWYDCDRCDTFPYRRYEKGEHKSIASD